MKGFLVCALLFFVSDHLVYSQIAQFPIVKGYGGIYEIADATERPDPTLEYKILVDLVTAAEDPKQISRWVDNIARLMNLHGLAGVPRENLHVKVIVHGGGISSILNDANYGKQHGIANPNLQVFEALKEAGAEILVCGQSLVSRKLTKSDIWEEVEIAHSMLTTVTTYVPQGYVLLKF